MKTLPCGCRTCGCMCEEHWPPNGAKCDLHVAEGLAHAVTELVALSLFIGAVLIWAAILA